MRIWVNNICIVLVCAILSVGCGGEESQMTSSGSEEIETIMMQTEQNISKFLVEYEKKNEEMIMSLNTMPTFEEMENLKACMKKIWIIDAEEGEEVDSTLFSFYITNIQGRVIEGKYQYGGIITPECYEKGYEMENKGTFIGEIQHEKIECCFYDEDGNEGKMTFISWENTRIEAEIECSKTTVVWQDNGEVNGIYWFRPYHFFDISDVTVQDEHSFELDLDSWGHVYLVSARVDNVELGRYYPATYLTDLEGNILYYFHPGYLAGTEIYDIIVEDMNGDGLKDIGVITGFSFYDNGNRKQLIRWNFYQMEDGRFYYNERDEWIE